MYMVDQDLNSSPEFGYKNSEGDIESVAYSESMVSISDGFNEFSIHPNDVKFTIKALEYMQKYLVDEGIIK